MMTKESNRRILLVDDHAAIHEDFKKILIGPRDKATGSLAAGKELLFGQSPRVSSMLPFEIDSAFQGAEALELARRAAAEGRPYSLAFVDVRMPPGWDGIETVKRIWESCPDLQIVICTAFSDYSWEQMITVLGHSDNLVILKKPFDNIEVLQLAHALTRKWNLTHQVDERTRQLQHSEERFAKAFRTNPLPMAIQSLQDERFIDVNGSFLQLCGYTRDQMIGRTPATLKLWQGENGSGELIARLRRREPVKGVAARLETKRGEVRDTLVYAELFEVEDEPCLLTLAEDTTERLRLETQLRQAQKMEAVGQLAAGIAHDFNNFLTIVQGHISLVLGRNDLEERCNRSLRQALTASERAGHLTRQLLAFSRKQVMERRPLPVKALFGQMNEMLHRLIGDQISIQFFCPAEMPSIHADRCNLEQVLINLALNARDAMPQGGDLFITASEVINDHAGVPRNSEALAGRFVCLTVTDTGCGMDAATSSRVFEPFFTTKEFGKGTGMGLATVYGIVKQHQGWIELESQPGRGTTFRIYLPVSIELPELDSIPPAAATSSSSGDAETILVVEDELLLLQFVQTVLEASGHHVLTATNASEALHVWRESSQEISLLLTDIVMPGGTSGKELAATLVAERPGLRVIYTTGYSVDLLQSGGDLGPLVSLLQKPYHVNMLIQTVQNCLGESHKKSGIANNHWRLTQTS